MITTITTTSTTTAAASIASGVSPGMSPVQVPSADALDRAIAVGDARVQEMQDQMLVNVFKLAFNMGEKSQILKDEQVRLRSEIALQKRSIELLEGQHQEKWTAHVEATKARMRAISSKISEIVKAIETQSKIDDSVLAGAAKAPHLYSSSSILHSLWRSELYCSCLSYFQLWLKSIDGQCAKPSEMRYSKQSIPKSTLAHSVEVMTHSEMSAQMIAIPQIALLIQPILVQEREVAVEKQELASLKQLYESKKKDHQNSIAEWKYKYSFESCLEHANTVKKTIEAHIEYVKKSFAPYPYHVWSDHTGIAEGTRLKGLVCAIISDIEQAIAWIKGVTE